MGGYFRGIRNNHDSAGYKLAQSVLGDASSWMSEEVVGERLLAVATEEGVPTGPEAVVS